MSKNFVKILYGNLFHMKRAEKKTWISFQFKSIFFNFALNTLKRKIIFVQHKHIENSRDVYFVFLKYSNVMSHLCVSIEQSPLFSIRYTQTHQINWTKLIVVFIGAECRVLYTIVHTTYINVRYHWKTMKKSNLIP